MPRFADGLGRICALVAVSTTALAVSFVGLVALAAGDVQGATARLPALGVDDGDDFGYWAWRNWASLRVASIGSAL